MPKGRPPAPTILNALKGDPSRRRRHTTEPEPLDGVPACPDHLDDIAREEWTAITQILRDMKLLSRADRSAIELYCVSYSRYRRAAENVAKYGDVVLSPNKKFPMVSPYAVLMGQSFEQCRKMLIEFGLTPAARSRMRVSVPQEKQVGWLKVG